MSYIFLYLEDSPIHSYFWKTVLFIPIFQGKQEMLNYFLKQMLLISNFERCMIGHYWRNLFSMKMEDGKIKYKCLPELDSTTLERRC